jgi:hypothetical protein
MSKRRIGAEKWNEFIRQGRDAVEILRDDIDELRAANEENLDVLNFLITMSKRLDTLSTVLMELWEIGIVYKSSRAIDDGDANDGERPL